MARLSTEVDDSNNNSTSSTTSTMPSAVIAAKAADMNGHISTGEDESSMTNTPNESAAEDHEEDIFVEEEEGEEDQEEEEEEEEPDSLASSLRADSPLPPSHYLSSLSRFPPNPPSATDYELIEFTLDIKQVMIALLNGAIPEVVGMDSFDDTNQVYWRLCSLAHFFNLMFDTRTVLYIEDLAPPSMRQFTPSRLASLNRYLRFWLAQFYDCDEVIGELFTLSFLYT